MKKRLYQTEQWLPLEPDAVFDFFANAENLNAITPPWLFFHIVTSLPIDVKAGAIIDYKLKLHGVPLKWKTHIRDWEPCRRFVDEQIKGPFKCWIHEHTFEASNGGTLMRDTIEYAVPFDFFAHPLFVRKDVERIFSYRKEELAKRFNEHQL